MTDKFAAAAGIRLDSCEMCGLNDVREARLRAEAQQARHAALGYQVEVARLRAKSERLMIALCLAGAAAIYLGAEVAGLL